MRLTFLTGQVALLALFCLAFTGCGGARAASELQVELEFDPAPPSVGKTKVRLRLRSPEGEGVVGAKVQAEGNMNHAGMVPEFFQPVETAPGEYEGTIDFVMGGDWYMALTVETKDRRVLKATVDVPGVAWTRGSR